MAVCFGYCDGTKRGVRASERGPLIIETIPPAPRPPPRSTIIYVLGLPPYARLQNPDFWPTPATQASFSQEGSAVAAVLRWKSAHNATFVCCPRSQVASPSGPPFVYKRVTSVHCHCLPPDKIDTSTFAAAATTAPFTTQWTFRLSFSRHQHLGNIVFLAEYCCTPASGTRTLAPWRDGPRMSEYEAVHSRVRPLPVWLLTADGAIKVGFVSRRPPGTVE
ncbi:hypothetical protein J6590_037736 [Homalodisca vitripennis]|nr:hypothetical protein J6590_037736 [Homalodisca vitripennis]